MSAHDIHAGHAHDAHDDHHDAGPHSTFSGYMTGFVLSIILTAIPFWLIMAKVIEGRSTAVLVLGAFAIVQILVHMYYFLHMNSKVEAGWTLLSLSLISGWLFVENLFAQHLVHKTLLACLAWVVFSVLLW
ncbi:MAG: cytochrome C oxidase subunit IV family protein, partial [Comamonas sp.]